MSMMNPTEDTFDTYEFEGLIGVGNVKLELVKDQRVYTLIGSNGVGKTKCLEALFQLLFYEPCFSNNGGGNGEPILFKIACRNDHEFKARSSSHSKQYVLHQYQINIEKNLVYIGAALRAQSKKDNGSIKFGTSAQRRQKHLNYIVDSMRVDFKSLGNEPNGLDDWFVKRAQSGSPLMKNDDNRLVEINSLIDVLHNMDNRFDLDANPMIQISGDETVELSIGGEWKKLSELSSGFMSLLKILQAIISGYGNLTNETNLTDVKGMVFIDEIESHLHSEWQVKIIPFLKKSFPNTTFFITTHSPLVLTQLEEGEAYLLERDKKDGVVRSELLKGVDKRLFVDVAQDAFGVDLEALKRQRLEQSDQSEAKQKLKNLLFPETYGLKDGESK